VIVEGTSVDAISACVSGRFDNAIRSTSSTLISSGSYTLLWDLAKSDL
jgi:hypothetical protein